MVLQGRNRASSLFCPNPNPEKFWTLLNSWNPKTFLCALYEKTTTIKLFLQGCVTVTPSYQVNRLNKGFPLGLEVLGIPGLCNSLQRALPTCSAQRTAGRGTYRPRSNTKASRKFPEGLHNGTCTAISQVATCLFRRPPKHSEPL